MSYRFKAALCGVLAVLGSGYAQAALDEVAQAVSAGDYSDALSSLDSVPAAERNSIEGQLLQAAAVAGSGDMESAEAQYKALIEQAPKLPEAYNNLAVLYARQGKLDEARKLLERAMRTNPSYATVYDNLSNIYVEMSRTAYAKALQIGNERQGPSLKPLYAVNGKPPEPAEAMVAAASPEKLPPPPPAIEPVAEEVAVAKEAAAVVVPDAAAEDEAKSPSQASEAAVVEASPADSAAPVEEPKSDVAVANAAGAAKSNAETADTSAKTPATASKEAVVAMIKGWAADWAGQNVDGYLNAYAEDFRPGRGLNHSQWKAQRRQRLRRPDFIQVKLQDIKVRLEGGERAIVDLVQRYRSDHYSDLTRKRFRLLRKPDGWKIVSEKTIEVL